MPFLRARAFYNENGALFVSSCGSPFLVKERICKGPIVRRNFSDVCNRIFFCLNKQYHDIKKGKTPASAWGFYISVYF